MSKEAIKKLKEEKAELIKEAKKLSAIAETRTHTAEERADLDTCMSKLDDHEERICTLERSDAMEDGNSDDGGNDGGNDDDSEEKSEEKAKPAPKGVGRRTRPTLPNSMRDRSNVNEYASNQNYMISRALGQVARNERVTGIEGEVSREISIQSRKEPLGFFMPLDLNDLNQNVRKQREAERRDLTLVSGSGAVPTIWTEDFIEYLYNVTLLPKLGCTFMSGLEHITQIPRMSQSVSGAGGVQVVAEEGSASASNETFDFIKLIPRTLTANVTVSRKFLMQASMPAEAMVKLDIARSIGVKLDTEAFLGSGTGNEGIGVLNDPNNTNVISTGGSTITYKQAITAVQLVKQASVPFVPGSMNWVTSPLAEGVLKSSPKVIGGASVFPIYIEGDDNQMAGYPVYSSAEIPNNFTVSGLGSTYSVIIFGAWNQLICAQFSGGQGSGIGGGLDLLIDPFSQSTSGSVRFTGLLDYDFGIRHSLAFSLVLGQPTS